MAKKEYPFSKYKTADFEDNSIAQVAIKPGGIVSESFAEGAITTEKIENGSITGDNFPNEVVTNRTLNKNLKSSIALDPNIWLPIMRFSRWTSHSSSQLYGGANFTGKQLMESLVGYSNTGHTSKYFTGMSYARVGGGGHGAVWSVETPQLLTYSGWYQYQEISVICLRNTKNTSVTVNPYVYFSSYTSTPYAMAYFTVKNGIDFDGNGEPVVSSLSSGNNISDVWSYSSNTTSSANVGSIVVPAGKGIIMMLKTSPAIYTNDGTAYFYHNYHGFTNLGETSNWGIKSINYPNNPLEVSVPLYKALMTKVNN